MVVIDSSFVTKSVLEASSVVGVEGIRNQVVNKKESWEKS